MNRHPAAAIAALAGATIATALIGKNASGRTAWYRLLRKPNLQPPPAVFGPVWTVLYALTTLSGWFLYQAKSSRARSAGLGLYAVQQTFSAAWTPLFFGAHKPKLAMVDLALLFGTLGAYTTVAAKADKRAALLVAPVLAWVGFAGYLNAGIIAKNPRLLLD
jgi:tryptophan-rich sensory protein